MTGLRVVVLNGEQVDPARACLSVDDPAVRSGEGIFETMRADGGRVPFLRRHLDRLMASIAALEIGGMPERAAMERDVHSAVAAAGAGPLKVRLTASPAPTVLVEVTPVVAPPALARRGLSAISLRGWWIPEHRMAEQYGMVEVYELIAARFGLLRVALNTLSDTLLFPHANTPERLMRQVQDEARWKRAG